MTLSRFSGFGFTRGKLLQQLSPSLHTHTGLKPGANESNGATLERLDFRRAGFGSATSACLPHKHAVFIGVNRDCRSRQHPAR